MTLAPSRMVRPADLDSAALRKLATAFRDPVAFTSILMGDYVWSVSGEIMRSVARPRSRTAVKACHSSSKTWTASRIVVWWLARYADGIVVTTGPTQAQVKEMMWQEIRKANAKGLLEMPVEPNLQDWHLADGNFALGRATNQGVRMQGFHGRVLFIVDEAPGVTDSSIWEAIEGVAAGGDVRVLAMGNPTVSSGPFYDLYEREAGAWNLLTIDAQDTPNFVGVDIEELPEWDRDDPRLDVCPYPFLVTRRWVYDRAEEWGTNSAAWQARVRGQFPDQSSDALIARSWIEAAAQRAAVDDGGPKRAGIDVAGPGEDETAAYVVRGPNVLAWRAFQGDARDAVVAFLAEQGGPQAFERVNVDTAGIGYYFERHLHDAGYRTTAVNVGASPMNGERYANLKAELYWGMRLRFKDGDVHGLTDPVTRGQLGAILWEQNARNQVEIESKDDARKRGVKSPDRAEALMLAFANPEPSWLQFVRLENERRRA